MEYITLEENSVQRFGIRTKDGKETGEYIEIDPEDIDFQFRANECQEKHKKNVTELQNKLNEIEQTCNKDGEFPTERDWARREACKEFMAKEEKTIDDFIGDGTTKKLLNGRKPYILMFNDIMDMLTQIVPALKDTSKKILENIREKYNKNNEQDNVI
jgi:hypothetical protein